MSVDIKLSRDEKPFDGFADGANKTNSRPRSEGLAQSISAVARRAVGACRKQPHAVTFHLPCCIPGSDHKVLADPVGHNRLVQSFVVGLVFDNNQRCACGPLRCFTRYLDPAWLL
jgi:hypothetical protein